MFSKLTFQNMLALLLAIGFSAVSAFLPQQLTTSQLAIESTKMGTAFSVLLEASRCKSKVASLEKWAESRNNQFSGTSADNLSKSRSTKRAPTIIIAGAPASGKGTQCERIKEKYGVVHLSTGDMLRAAVASGTEVGKKAKDFMDAGKLVPDEVIIGVVKDRLNEPDCITCGWLLDGFPRTPAQAQALSSAGISADCFIFLNVPDEILVERVIGRRTDPVTGKIYHLKFSPPDDTDILHRLEQRSDDTEEKVKVRLEQFHANVDAVRDSFMNIAVEVDGTNKPDEVSASIIKAIDAVLV